MPAAESVGARGTSDEIERRTDEVVLLEALWAQRRDDVGQVLPSVGVLSGLRQTLKDGVDFRWRFLIQEMGTGI